MCLVLPLRGKTMEVVRLKGSITWPDQISFYYGKFHYATVENMCNEPLCTNTRLQQQPPHGHS